MLNEHFLKWTARLMKLPWPQILSVLVSVSGFAASGLVLAVIMEARSGHPKDLVLGGIYLALLIPPFLMGIGLVGGMGRLIPDSSWSRKIMFGASFGGKVVMLATFYVFMGAIIDQLGYKSDFALINALPAFTFGFGMALVYKLSVWSLRDRPEARFLNLNSVGE